MTDVDYHFDLLCPWAYHTSKWIREARSLRDINVTWRFFSLEEVNRGEGKKHPWERPWSYGWSMLRVAALLRREPDGNAEVDRFYQLAGRRLHEEGLKVHSPEGMEEVLRELGKDPRLVTEAVSDETTNDEVRADHQSVVDRGGFGVPTLVIDGQHVLFGPAIVPAPRGEDAGRLWDAVVAWSQFPHLYELRRPKVQEDWDHIGAQFEPYAKARDWQTVQTPVA
jgi:2-hydroxychromene-2-carboxylate isomerase